jgi:hypothetical protein
MLHQPGDLPDEPHGPADHGEDHGHDDHAHASEALGPIDVERLGAFVVGTALGLIVVIGISLATS